VQPPIRAQSWARSLAVRLNTADVEFTLVPAGGIGFVAQPETNSVQRSNAVNTNNSLFVRFMIGTPSLIMPSDILDLLAQCY
jgi:hypothetical protein